MLVKELMLRNMAGYHPEEDTRVAGSPGQKQMHHMVEVGPGDTEKAGKTASVFEVVVSA
jgi:hypothetical protein